MKSTAEKPRVIAYRKSCRPTGTGLSHYVLLTATPEAGALVDQDR